MNINSIIISCHLKSSWESTKSNNIKEIMFSILRRVGRRLEGCDRVLVCGRIFSDWLVCFQNKKLTEYTEQGTGSVL